jgi:2-polyprenyl-3-methyl-5-hydroxy-6-metoxy-1,4-benzoquinol methylase
MGRKTMSEWERLARQEPWFSVLTHDEFHGLDLADDVRERFFASGESYTASLFEKIHRFIDPQFRPSRVLDFGCGVARVAIPLSRRADEVTAVDVAPTMLDLASRYAAEAGARNIRFKTTHELEASDDRFDLIHSFLVFQHIPMREGMRLMSVLLERAAPGSVIALHLLYARRGGPARRLGRWARARLPLLNALANIYGGVSPSQEYMQMNAYEMSDVLLLLSHAGVHEVHLVMSETEGMNSVTVIGRVDRP